MSQLDLFNSGSPKYSSLGGLFKVMMQMKDDPLAKAGTNVVISRGNLQAKLLIVGECAGSRGKYQGRTLCRARYGLAGL
jgi:uracil-DNA glycosylase